MDNQREKHPRRIAVLGSTGSMGTQALEVIALHPDVLQLEVIAANSSADLLIEQAKKYHPNIVVVVQEEAYRTVKEALAMKTSRSSAARNPCATYARWTA